MRKTTLPLVAFLCFLQPFVAFADKKPGDAASMAAATEKIKAEAEHSKVMDIAFYLTDVSGPRLTISPGFTRAANWAKDEMTKMGLSNAHLEPWGEFGKGWQQEKCYVAMTAPYYAPMIAIPKAWTTSTPGKKEFESEVVLLDATDSATFVSKYGGKLAGKIVMMATDDMLKPSFEPDASRYTEEELDKMAKAEMDPDRGDRRPRGDSAFMKRMQAYREARKITELLNNEKPGLILSSQRGNDGTVFVQQGGSQVLGTPDAPATVAISNDDFFRMQRLLKAGIPVKVAADVRTKTFTGDNQGYNVIAEIPGTDPKLKDELVLAGGHLDSWQGMTGATDNAAGCAVMMEALRLIKASGLQPRRTIRIVLWSGEEQGLFGSKNYVKNHIADPETMALQPDHEKISAYFNLDNGSGRIRGVYCQGNLAVMPIFQQWLDNFGDSTAHTVTINNTGGTDHLSFDAVGIPGFQFIQDGLEYNTRTHHSNMDSYDHLVAEDLVQASTLAASFIYNAAQQDEKLPRKELPKARPASSRF